MTGTGGSPQISSKPSASNNPSTTLTAQQLQALRAAVVAEHTAVYAYGVVGAQISSAGRADALAALQRHALQRDLLAGRLSVAGKPVPAGAAAYVLPAPVRSPAAARALAAHVEQALCAVYADLVAATDPGGRSEAARWLTDSTMAAYRWGAAPQTFPGLPERADPTADPRLTAKPNAAKPNAAKPSALASPSSDPSRQGRSTS